MAGHHMLDSLKQGLASARELDLPLTEHVLKGLPLEIGLTAAQIAGDDRIGHAPGKAGDGVLITVKQRANEGVLTL